jgi:D-glycero-alpha-D-manno-heptose-7-phosphate kinase
MPTKQQLTKEAIHLEQTVLGETVGSQDQTVAAHGGLRHVKFHTDGEIEVAPLVLPPGRVAELKSHLLLVYTGIVRTAADVAQSYVPGIETKRRQLRIMKEMVDEAIEILTGGVNLLAFGELLHEAWLAKRSLSAAVSNPEVDALYRAALDAGAIGGKLTGAGGGGFLLLFAPPDRRADVLAALGECIHVPFEFESGGSQIIFYEPGTDYEAADRARGPRRRVFKELTRPALRPTEAA